MRLLYLPLIPALLLSGCATNLPAVREFADETKKIGVAFDPVLNRTVEACKQGFLQHRIYTTSAPLANFDAEAAIKQASDLCQPIADKNAIAKGLSKALSEYAGQLSALAADGVASSVDDNYDALAAKLNGFEGVPQDKVGAIAALLKFVTRSLIAKSQRDAIVDALSHEDAVGALADGLVQYSDRVYSGYLKERLNDQPLFVEVLRAEASTPISSRLRMMDVHQQTLALQEQKKATAQLRAAVGQMKTSMRDLRQNVDKLSDKERLLEVRKLTQEVKALYQQLAQAF
jgi:hypothetical protein